MVIIILVPEQSLAFVENQILETLLTKNIDTGTFLLQ